MLIGEFARAHETTKDTVRFYVERGLLTPARKGRNYWYDEQAAADFAAVRELQALGFSIATIQKLRERHLTQCGTHEQWEANRTLVAEELAAVDAELAALQDRRQRLTAVARELDERLNQ